MVGEDFPTSRFLRTPIGAIISVLNYIDNEEQRTYNLNSITVAKLCTQVVAIAHGMAGSRGRPPKIKMEDYLPFPDWSPESAQQRHGPSEETRSVLTELLKKKKLPMSVFVQLLTAPT